MDTLSLHPNRPYLRSSLFLPMMAPTLTSNPFLSNPTPPHSHSRLRNRRLTVFAKNTGPLFRLGKRSDDSSSDQSEDSTNSSPFRFDFGKLPDMKSLVPVVAKPATGGLSFGNQRKKDAGTVFVAGATGQAGVRISQSLLREGFTVRAGVPELGAAQELARLAANYKIISNEESKRLNAVESNFDNAESIARAIGNASKVVVTIGPSGNGPTTEVTPSDALQVIQAAQLARVAHVAIIYDGSTSTSSYNVLDGISTFFSNLLSQSQPLTMAEFLKSVVETTDVRYTLIKTKLTEDYAPESSYKIVVSAEGSAGAYDYKVATWQIASLVADVFSNTAVAENKVVEVFTDPSAPLKSVDELFGPIPEDGRRKAYAKAIAKAKAEEEAVKASEQAREAAVAAKKLGEEVKKLERQEARATSLAEEAQEKAAAAGTAVDSLLDKAKDMTSSLSWENFSSQLKSAVQTAPIEMPKVQVATVRGQTRARNLTAKKAVTKKAQPKPTKPKREQKEPEGEVRKVFGGLFQQQTIYVDDD
ncbi:hypothetical protein LguiA_012055 [Lonicera macranthoides]